MRMDHVDSVERLHLRQVQAQGLESAFEFALGPVGNLGPRLSAPHVQPALVRLLRAPAMHLNFNLFGQLAAQIIDMHPGAAVHLGRVFAREQSNSQCFGLRPNLKLPSSPLYVSLSPVRKRLELNPSTRH